MADYFVHPNAICETTAIGAGTRIWAFAHILPGAKIGRDCNICDHTFIENQVVIGDRVTIKCGVQVWDGVRLEADVFVGPNATFTNDLKPRSKQYLPAPLETVVEAGASIGANATILPGIRIGEKALIGAGAVVTHSVPPNAIVVGNPAQITGYMDSVRGPDSRRDGQRLRTSDEGTVQTSVTGVTLHRLRNVEDLRGNLSAGEFGRDIPFIPKRYFLVFDVPSRRVRGEHAHVACAQFLVCVNGSLSVVVDDGTTREEFLLDSRNLGLYLPPMTWGIQYRFSPDAILMVFASDHYDPQDYIRDYREFKARKPSQSLREGAG
jgi:acetyltransferase-like isoleucine patch superfamily enzyme/dTDP-4-dehydrorhamnose 3,5-epimerase-like enzyme